MGKDKEGVDTKILLGGAVRLSLRDKVKADLQAFKEWPLGYRAGPRSF